MTSRHLQGVCDIRTVCDLLLCMQEAAAVALDDEAPRHEGASGGAGSSHACCTRRCRSTAVCRKGYHRTGTEEVVAEAGVVLVVRSITTSRISRRYSKRLSSQSKRTWSLEAAKNLADPADGALNQLRQGLIGFLDASLTPHVQRILLIDGPAVLGWVKWRELESRYGLGAIRAMLERAIDEGDLAVNQPRTLRRTSYSPLPTKPPSSSRTHPINVRRATKECGP